MTNLVAGPVLGLVTIGAAVVVGDASISGESRVNLSEVVSVGVAVCGLVWWLGRKFQAIEDALKEHGRTLEKLPCVKSTVTDCSGGEDSSGAFGAAVLAGLITLTVTGCMGTRPLKGGKATTVTKPAQVVEQTVVQSENPAAVSKQDQETVRVKTYTVPAGSRIEETKVVAGLTKTAAPVTNVQTVVVSAPMPVVEREETRARTELGAAQKDTARELGAKLASLKGIIWVGLGLFLFGLASLVYPPLKAVIASATTSLAMIVGGLALMILPTLIVGNELLILGGVALAVGGWLLAHRYGRMRGFVDANQNGVDDREEAAANSQGGAHA